MKTEYKIFDTIMKKIEDENERQKIVDSLEDICIFFDKNQMIETIKRLQKYPDSKVFINENWDNLIQEMIKNDNDPDNILDLFKLIDEFKEIPKNNKYVFLSDLYKKLISDIEKIDNMDSSSKLNYHMNHIYNLDSHIESLKDTIWEILQSKDLEEITTILEDIKNKEGELEYKNMGGCSIVLKSGDKAVKLGTDRKKYPIPYHPRIMQPKFRKKYDNNIYFEIFDYGNIDKAKISSETVLQIFKELEKDGIFWGDARKDNVLVLKKDNDLPEYIKGENFNLFGYIEDEKNPLTKDKYKALKKGDYVICDLDYLFLENDPEKSVGILDDIVTYYLIAQDSKKHRKQNDNKEKTK